MQKISAYILSFNEAEKIEAAVGSVLWADEVVVAGPANVVCRHLHEPVSRAALRRLVAERHRALADAGLRRGGSVALCLAPSLAFIANLLASCQIGAQASLPTVGTAVLLGAVTADTRSAWNPATWTWTAPVPGVYYCYGQAPTAAASTRQGRRSSGDGP